MKKILISATLMTTALAPEISEAASLLCNQAQTHCVTQNKNLTIGDPVGVINTHGELVATGQIMAMRGEKRALTITKRHGSITTRDRIALLSGGPDHEDATSYRIYKEPAKHTVGATVAYGFSNVGSGAPGFALSPYGTMRYREGLEFVARGLYASYSTSLAIADGQGSENLPYELRQLGLLGGVGYRILESRPISFRGEFSLGLTNVAATIDGDKDLVDKEFRSRAKVQNGWAPMGRWSFGAHYRINKKALVTLEAVQSLVHQALSSGMAIGASLDLP